ncbi:MAG: hypothetical protein KF729_03880 [Sandaracinaceae bacterium]|nr:hypothetical protein [Sandaracinaceae bacterium]
MDLFSTDPERPGVFAVGQIAYGVFALGQMATGVIAIGQVARGVIAVGQGAVGVVAIGQGAIGVLYAGGMVAVGGRGFGGILKVLPKVRLRRFQRPKLPPLSTLAELAQAARGWLLCRVTPDGLEADGRPAPLELTDEARGHLETARAEGHTHACVTVTAEERVVEERGASYRAGVERERVLVARRLSSWFEGQPRVHLEGPLTGAGGLLLRAVGMVALAYAWWLLAGTDVAALFVTPGK